MESAEEGEGKGEREERGEWVAERTFRPRTRRTYPKLTRRRVVVSAHLIVLPRVNACVYAAVTLLMSSHQLLNVELLVGLAFGTHALRSPAACNRRSPHHVRGVPTAAGWRWTRMHNARTHATSTPTRTPIATAARRQPHRDRAQNGLALSPSA